MSSPLAKPNKMWIERKFVHLHRSLSHDSRVSILSREIAQELSRHVSSSVERLNGIDIGCGDMGIAESIELLDHRIRWECLDLYALPEELAKSDPRWRKYRQFDGRKIDCGDGTADFALLTDVLHHVPDAIRPQLLQEAARVAKFVIVKDHFEYGAWSRSLLRLMDFVGNWGYGVSVPREYFSTQTFQAFCKHAGLRIVSLRVGIDLYHHLAPLNLLLRRQWHFIAVVTR